MSAYGESVFGDMERCEYARVHKITMYMGHF